MIIVVRCEQCGAETSDVLVAADTILKCSCGGIMNRKWTGSISITVNTGRCGNARNGYSSSS